MTTATRNRGKRTQVKVTDLPEVLDITPNEDSFDLGPQPTDLPEVPEEEEVPTPEDEEIETEEVEDTNEGGEVELVAPNTGANGRVLKYTYPQITGKDGITREMTQKEKQQFRRQARAAARKGQDISKALKNPSAAGKTRKGQALLKQVLPKCERCGEEGDTAMALVLPGDFLDHLNEKRQAHLFPVHKNSCMLPTDIELV